MQFLGRISDATVELEQLFFSPKDCKDQQIICRSYTLRIFEVLKMKMIELGCKHNSLSHFVASSFFLVGRDRTSKLNLISGKALIQKVANSTHWMQIQTMTSAEKVVQKQGAKLLVCRILYMGPDEWVLDQHQSVLEFLNFESSPVQPAW